MDAKSLREAMKSKAKRLAGASSDKVDSSDYTPPEQLNADVKTGMRPISRRAFKSGGKVEGEDNKGNASRTPRGNIGLANTNQRVANEERDGKKHVGGFNKGGRTAKMDGGMMSSPRPKARPDDLMATHAFHRSMRATDNSDAPADQKTRPAARMTPEETKAQQMLNSAARSGDGYKKGGMVGSDNQPVSTAGGDAGDRQPKKKGGMVEGSAKDKAEDKVLAKKAGMSMKQWEKSDADKAHDKGCTCKACGGRVGRKSGGKVGKTNINIIISPHHDGKLGSMGPQPGAEAGIPKPPMPAPAPMPAAAPPAHMALPPGLGAAMAGAAGAGPAGAPAPGGMPMRPPMPGPMMARKTGGRVEYPITGGAGGGKARKEKVEAYGEKMNKDLKK